MVVSTNRRISENQDDDIFTDDAPRSIFSAHQNNHQHPYTAKQSTAVMKALEDEDSELSRFLLCGSKDDEDDDMKRRIGVDATWYQMALEPIETRNGRLTMLFELYAIFGALFMQAVWIIYEWGNDNYTEGNPNVDRAFYFIMSIALVSNVFLALYGCFCWMLSVIIDSSNEDFVFQSRKMLTLLQNMLMFTGNFVFLGLLLGIYKNLSPNLPETIITLVVAISMRILGDRYWGRQISICCPLEYYHFPRYIQIMMGLFTKAQRDELKGRAKIRADKLRKKAYIERKKLDPGFRDETNSSSITTLLRTAAINLGRNDLDVTIYEERLEEDLFNEAVHLKGRSVECLSRYMPLRLAEEVYRLLLDVTEEEVQYDCS